MRFLTDYTVRQSRKILWFAIFISVLVCLKGLGDRQHNFAVEAYLFLFGFAFVSAAALAWFVLIGLWLIQVSNTARRCKVRFTDFIQSERYQQMLQSED